MSTASDRYIARLAAPRDIWINGKSSRIPLHEPAFQGSIDIIKAYYTLMARPEYQAPFNGTSIPITLSTAYSKDDLALKRKAYKEVADLSFGMLGRTPDFINAALSTLYVHSDFFGSYRGISFKDNIERFYHECADQDLFVGHGAINPQIDRSRSLGEQITDYAGIHVISEDEDGIVVQGAKMIVTLAPIADELLIFNMPGLKPGDEAYAIAFRLPLTTAGTKIICRKPTFRDFDEFNYPLSNVFDEIDAFLVLENVFIPWKHVFIYKDIERTNRFYDATFTRHHTGHQGIVRALSKAELVIAIAEKVADTLGLNTFINIQEKLGQMTTAFELSRAAILMSEVDATLDDKGVCNPSISAIQAFRYHFPKWYAESLQTIQSLAAGSMLAVPHSEDFHNENSAILRSSLSTERHEAQERAWLLNAAWDIAGEAFGQRQAVYETYHAGDPMRIAATHYLSYDKTGIRSALVRLAARQSRHQEDDIS